MKIANLADIKYIDLNFCELEVFPESWTKSNTFTQYKSSPRPCSALFFICGDIKVTFYPKGCRPLTAERGDLVWIPAGSVYYAESQGNTDRHIVSYTLNFRLIDENREPLLLSDEITILAHGQSHALKTRIEALNNELHRIENAPNKTKPNYIKIKSQFYALLDDIASAKSENNDFYYPIRIGAEALKNEWNQNRNVDEYADMCSVSSTYFYRCFKRWSGKSPVEYRNMIRLSNAEAMLRHTDMKISEISAAVGFEDPFYFCRVFSKSFGMSPKSYRKNLRQDSYPPSAY